MKILAIESSALVASVAVLEEDTMIAEYTLNHKKTHSQTLLPMIDEISRMTELDLKTLDAVAISGGPGSFTGLRIGSATAKGIGLALDVPLIHVPTVDALALNLCGAEGLIAPMMDARRNQVYCGIYHFAEDGVTLVTDLEQAPRSVEELMLELNKRGQKVCLLGDGVPPYRAQAEELLTVPHWYAPAHQSRQRAGAVAYLAAQYYREGRVEHASDHKPEYLRVSQAERERAEREQAAKAREAGRQSGNEQVLSQ